MKMLRDYENFVTGLASTTSLHSFEAKLGTAGLGLAGEAGEIADLTKKLLYHGMPFDEEVRQKLISECSDLLWYLQFAITHVCGITIEELIDFNIKKLSARYKSLKFSTEEFMAKESAKNDDLNDMEE